MSRLFSRVNPFVALLIIVPLLVSILFTTVSFLAIFWRGGQWDVVVAFLIFAGITATLVYMLIRTSRGSLLKFKGSDQVDLRTQRQATAFVLFVLYLTLGIIALLFIYA